MFDKLENPPILGSERRPVMKLTNKEKVVLRKIRKEFPGLRDCLIADETVITIYLMGRRDGLREAIAELRRAK